MSVMGSIEERLAALKKEIRLQRDHIEIGRLIASYGPLVDTSDRIERSRHLSMLWTQDGVYDIGGVGIRQGREAIAAVFREARFAQVPDGSVTSWAYRM